MGVDLAALRAHLAAALALLDAAAEPVAAPPENPDDVPARPIAWGAKVSETFRRRVWWISRQIEMDPDHLMSCMAFETGETFAPDERNKAGSGATGLIQFMPATARALGTTTEALAAMSAEDQLRYVYQYFRPFAGRCRTLADTYMAILLPKYVGAPDDARLFVDGTTAYRQNAGLDANRDGQVTKLEAAAKVLAKLAKGRKPENMA